MNRFALNFHAVLSIVYMLGAAFAFPVKSKRRATASPAWRVLPEIYIVKERNRHEAKNIPAIIYFSGTMYDADPTAGDSVGGALRLLRR